MIEKKVGHGVNPGEGAGGASIAISSRNKGKERREEEVCPLWW